MHHNSTKHKSILGEDDESFNFYFETVASKTTGWHRSLLIKCTLYIYDDLDIPIQSTQAWKEIWSCKGVEHIKKC